jgi:hypothetical protein
MTLETAANRAAGQNKNTAAYGQELDGRRHEPVREDHPEPFGQLQVSDSRGAPEAAAGISNQQGASNGGDCPAGNGPSSPGPTGGVHDPRAFDDAARNVGVLVEVVAGTNSVVAVCNKERLAPHQEDG